MSVLDSAPRAADRDAVVGVRQLGHPVQGVRPAGRAARPVREDRRRRGRCTGSPASRRRVALHIPWDRVDDYARARPARARIAASRSAPINSNVFQDDDYKLGSVTNPDPGGAAQGDRPPARVRRHHGRDRVARPEAVVLRRHQLPRPGQHPGPAGPARRGAAPRSTSGSATTSGCCWSTSSSSRRSTRPTCPDWGTAYAHCLQLGDRAQVVIDTGHHAPGTNIEFIVAFLLRAGKLGAFDFNSRFYADDDLMVGLGRPVPAVPDHARDRARRRARRRRRASRSCSTSATTSSRRSPAMIRSVMNVQEATAKALLVDAEALAAAQRAGDVLGANGVLMDAYNTDVRPLLARAARGAWASTPTRWRPTGGPATPRRSSRERVGGEAGRVGCVMSAGRGAAGPEQPARRRPAQHQLRRRQHLGQGRPRPTRSPGSRSSCCGSRDPAATSAR